MKVLIWFQALFCILHSIILLSSLPPLLEAFVRARVGAAKIFNTIENVPRVDNFSDKGDTPEFLSGDIEFSHVDFAYSSRPGAKVGRIICANNRPHSFFFIFISQGSKWGLLQSSKGSDRSNRGQLRCRKVDHLQTRPTALRSLGRTNPGRRARSEIFEFEMDSQPDRNGCTAVASAPRGKLNQEHHLERE